MTDNPRRVIAWFRRDLRLVDNRMLAAATGSGAAVYPVFVADRELLERHVRAPARVAWYAATLQALERRLGDLGSGLVILAGDPADALRDYAARIGAETVFAGRDEEPRAVQRDGRVAAEIELRLVDDQRLVPPGELRTEAGEPYRVFSPFRRALDQRLVEERAELTGEAAADLGRLAAPPDDVESAHFPAPDPGMELPDAGEQAADERLRDFTSDDLRRYRQERDRPDLDSTSRISPYLRVGSLSVRAAWRAAMEAEDEARARRDRAAELSTRRWRDELAWREFYAAVLHGHPQVVERPFRPEYLDIGWEEGPGADAALAAWSEGRTGYPIVDAGMRQLRATGWMHNRLRLITASFLVKDLGIDWRRGEQVFMEHLLDGDVAQNNGNWQWVAGVGTDAAPYFRIFNPTVQASRFDPDGTFVRSWLTELDGIPPEFTHEPWRAPAEVRPRDYPEPLVDHSAMRKRTLDRYASARRS